MPVILILISGYLMIAGGALMLYFFNDLLWYGVGVGVMIIGSKLLSEIYFN